MKPLVSILMPAYNVEKYINKAIESVLEQSYQNWELLICDDGSTDKTFDLINQFNDHRIKIFKNTKNIGYMLTNNRILFSAKGDYITTQDADDWCLPSRIQDQLDYFNLHPETGILGTNYMVIDELETEKYCGLLPLTDHEIKQNMHKEVIPLLGASVMIRKEIVNQTGGFRPFFKRRGLVDLDWLARCSLNAKTSNLNKVLYVYRHHSQSVSRNYPNELVKSFLHELVIEAHQQRINGKIDFIERRNLIEIKYFISKVLLKRGKTAYWNNEKSKALSLIKKSILAFPLNFNAFRTFIYILRH